MMKSERSHDRETSALITGVALSPSTRRNVGAMGWPVRRTASKAWSNTASWTRSRWDWRCLTPDELTTSELITVWERASEVTELLRCCDGVVVTLGRTPVSHHIP